MKPLLIVFLAGLLGMLVLAGCSGQTKGADLQARGDFSGGDSSEPDNEGLRITRTTGSTAMGDVLIELTPRGVVNGKLSVDISMNTHSVMLSQFDLKERTTLKFAGRSVKPLEAPSLRGHHVSGTLVFDVGQDLDSYSIIIEGVPKVEERIFTWGREKE
ncbi:hypothetical protein D6789_00475 [Candidatus Woesearchaeota archaeon]|nr:MAG: hypothetical protein D6789_00475 [Candidatus Woesearchaeota archaeon]